MRSTLFIILLSLSFSPLSSPLDGLNKFGEGEMQVLFWHLYKAELYGGSDTFSLQDNQLSLKITYLRDINKNDLIDATVKQWQHIGFEHQRMPQWLSSLEVIWPNIKKGDVLIISKNQDNTATFFDKEKALGTIEPDFADAFLAIWLSKKTSQPKLREQLIGARNND